MERARRFNFAWMSAAGIGALMAGSLEEAHAQASNLPPVTIDAPSRQIVRRATPPRNATRARTTTRRVAAPARALQPMAAGAGGRGAIERGTGSVNGYVAQQSVTGTKTDSPILTTPQAISVVPRQQIEDQQAQTLSETLRYTPGATVNTYGANSLFDTVRVRGFQVPIYLDGLRLPTDSGTNFATARLEPYGLERVEVLRGPSSGLYGQSPPGGLLNAVSKRPQDQPFGEALLHGGSFDRLEGAIDINTPIDANGQWLMRITGVAREAGTQLDFQRDNRYFLAPSLTWRPNADTSFTILASVQHAGGRGYQQYVPGFGSALFNPNGRYPYSRYLGEPDYDFFNTEQALIGYAFEHRFNEYFQFRQNFRYTDASTNGQTLRVEGLLPDLRTGIRSALGVKAATSSLALDNQLQADFATGLLRHKVVAGVDIYDISGASGFSFGPGPTIDTFAPIYGAPVPPVSSLFVALDNKSTQTQVGGYLQDQVSFDRFLLTATGRYDQVNGRSTNNPTAFDPTTTTIRQNDSATTGRIGLSYLFDSGIAPYVAYATSFEPTIGVSATGEAFRPTTGESREIGVKFRPLGSRALFTAALFDVTQQNVLTTDIANPFFSTQTGEVRVRGIELEGRFSMNERLDVIAGYAHIDPRITRDNDGNIGNFVPNTPVSSGSLWGLYTFKDSEFAGWAFGAGVRYVGENYADAANSFRTRPYTLFDAVVSYDFGYRYPDLRGLKLQVNATNIGDTYYVANCSGTSYCSLGNARTVLASLRYQWGLKQ